MTTEELITKIRNLENGWNYTPSDDIFGVGWNHAKDEIIKMIEKELGDVIYEVNFSRVKKGEDLYCAFCEVEKSPSKEHLSECERKFYNYRDDLLDQLNVRKSGY